MKSGILTWVSHSNMPILSVDAQPNGFRFVTGGSDHKVCIWNLLPAISIKYEKPAGANILSAVESGNANMSVIEEKKHEDEDLNMNGNEHSKSEFDGDLDEHKSEGTVIKECEEALLLEDEEGYEDEIALMEGLIEDKSKRYQKLLAVLDNHPSPVNCVRWNPLGTLFTSCSDDGSIILWEYVGEMSLQGGLQKFMYNTSGSENNGRMMMGAGAAAMFEESKTQTQQEEQNAFEEWRNKRTWKRHEGGVSDLAWSPDSIHFASCGTDSQVIIWSINEAAPIKIIEAKANGITFDPFGKFMATQSSEDKSLTIWRIQQDFKIITQECTHTSYYKQSMSMSLFRRLSWSSDGQFISTTAGKVGGMHTAPLIERSSWKLAATLAGHSKTITSSRINSRLYRDIQNEDSQAGLSCYSIVAIASIDSTISVWKPGMDRPLTVVLDIFRMGTSDLSWGFNGNVLLASSHDGKVFIAHYMPGRLGQPLTELEKQLIIEKRYGASVLNEYKAHTKLVQSNHIQAAVTNQTNAQASEQKTLIVNGKKKIQPIMTRQYQGESYNIDPHMNPFHNQMLRDDSAISFKGNQQPGSSLQGVLGSFIQPSSSINEVIRPITQSQQPQPQIQPKNQDFNITKSIQSNPLVQVLVPDTTQPLLSLVDGSSEVKIGGATQPSSLNNNSLPQVQIINDLEEVKRDSAAVVGGGDLENSGKKTKKQPKKLKKDVEGGLLGQQAPNNSGLSAAIVPQVSNQSFVQQVSNGPQVQVLNAINKGNISQSTIQTVQKEQYAQLERLLSENSGNQTQQQFTVISLEDYQQLNSIQGKEEIQLTLPARDIFSEEIRILIQNIDNGSQNEFTRKRCSEIRMYSGSENVEVGRSLMDGEFIVMHSMCGAFYILYTSNGKMSIFNCRTTSPIKQGILIEGVCFIDSNEESMAFAILTLKGIISVYKVKILADFANTFQLSQETCTLDYQCSLQEILKQRNSQSSLFSASGESLDPLSITKVSVKSLRLLPDSSVLVFLSDSSAFEYDPRMRLWRQTLLKESSQAISSLYNPVVNGNASLKSGESQIPKLSTIPLLKDLSQVIAQLDSQTLNSPQQPADDELLTSHVQRNSLHDQQSRLNDLQESLSLYERLQMKSEFLYTLRMITLCILQLGDMQRLKDLLVEYKFVMNWEEEQQISKGRPNVITKDSALNNIIQMMNEANQDSDQEMADGEVKNKGQKPVIEKPTQMICGGMEKSEVFQSAILPVVKTICATLNCDVREYVSKLIGIMFGNNGIPNQQAQVSEELNQVQHVVDTSNPLFMGAQHHDYSSLQNYSFQQQFQQHHQTFIGHPHQQQQHYMSGIHEPPQMQLPPIQNVFSAAAVRMGAMHPNGVQNHPHSQYQ